MTATAAANMANGASEAKAGQPAAQVIDLACDLSRAGGVVPAASKRPGAVDVLCGCGALMHVAAAYPRVRYFKCRNCRATAKRHR